MLLVTSRARAYIYSGDWVADCPREGCGNVEYLCDQENPLNPASPRTRRRSQFLCSNCKYFTSDIEWPANGAELMEVLAVRPIPGTRNWYPRDHSVAVRAGIPHGQSVADLRDENAEHGLS
jgi:hypothetical protein